MSAVLLRAHLLPGIAAGAIVAATAHELSMLRLGWLAPAALVVWWFLVRPRVRPTLAVLVLLASPIVVVPLAAALRTTAAYVRGESRWSAVLEGRPGPESRNLDRAHRLFQALRPCAVPCVGAHTLVGIERAALIALVRMFGPPRNAYSGPYPEREFAFRYLLTQGTSIAASDWQARGLRAVPVDIPSSDRVRDRVPSREGQAVRFAVIENTCLLLGFQDTDSREVHLIDLERIGWFAMYREPLERRSE